MFLTDKMIKTANFEFIRNCRNKNQCLSLIKFSVVVYFIHEKFNALFGRQKEIFPK